MTKELTDKKKKKHYSWSDYLSLTPSTSHVSLVLRVPGMRKERRCPFVKSDVTHYNFQVQTVHTPNGAYTLTVCCNRLIGDG